MSRSTIPPRIQAAIWARAAGRCQYPGCNQQLVGDLVAGREDGTFGFIAHIVADVPGGPRGHPVESPRLAKSLDNLMLLCATHHKLVDVLDVDAHPVEVLRGMKSAHESRVELLTDIDRDRATHVLRFGADIARHQALVSTQEIFDALRPDHHPASRTTLDLEIIGCPFPEEDPAYWALQQRNLQQKFGDIVRGRIERQEIRHVSVFALAPQPLLIELGRQLGDILPAAVRQRHREPATWAWQPDQPGVAFQVLEPDAGAEGPVALKLGISATVTDDRLHGALGAQGAIWSLTAEGPHNDILRRPQDQAEFRRLLRGLFDRIKARHGAGVEIQVFPALPASLAVELGRVWMPKADPPMRVWDQRPGAGFVPTLTIA
jgi:hypothetical protein